MPASTSARICGARAAPLEFDPACPGGKELSCAGQGLLRRGIGSDRQVGDDRCVLGPAGHCSGVADHVLESHGSGVGVPEHNHAERVANQDEINARFVDQPGGGIIVSGQRRNFLPAQFVLPEPAVEVVHKRRAKSRADRRGGQARLCYQTARNISARRGRKCGEKLSDRTLVAGENEIRTQIGQRLQDEAARGEARVRQDEIGGVNDEFTGVEDVQIERPRGRSGRGGLGVRVPTRDG